MADSKAENYLKKKAGVIDLTLPAKNVPLWLSSTDALKMQTEPFPREALLAGSLYYPACGSDGGPVKYLSRWFQSFVYVDYHYNREDFLFELQNRPFSRYRVLGTRRVTMAELAPRAGASAALTRDELERASYNYKSYAKEPFCEWVVMERLETAPKDSEPKRFSLLYLCADGAAAYQALYVSNSLHAGAIAVIQSGYGFGRNWTDYTDPRGPLSRVVMGNPAGTPEIYLSGGFGQRARLPAPWPEYSSHLGWYDYHTNGNVGVWGRAQ